MYLLPFNIKIHFENKNIIRNITCLLKTKQILNHDKKNSDRQINGSHLCTHLI